ncbi:MAG TPA: glycoside hydrolase family 3 C-terminal domain-containing protein [Polyangia bacterium]|nr:glycoside hydrolase family 3 C-terminal domain-containing protein [Polyangia bacterium]
MGRRPARLPSPSLAGLARAGLGAMILATGLMCGRFKQPAAPSPSTAAVAARGESAADEGAPAVVRARALVARMTLDEKVSQMVNDAPAIPRLGIPAYDWWSEALHGVARAGVATVFPQAIGLAATWDETLLGQVAAAISDEARAKYQADVARDGGSGRYHGLTFFSPNVNIFRDPRWGRGQETYGEDPFLTARLAVSFIRGLQGDDPRYLKVAAVAKHFAAHSGPEAGRHAFAVEVGEHDLRDTYLPQFEAAVREGGVQGIMPAYNRLNGQPCAANPRLLGDLLRGEWGFDGVVISDCGAIDDIVHGHHAAGDAAQAAAAAVKAGTDLSCGDSFRALGAAARAGLVDEATIDRAVTRLFAVRFRLGMFDAPARVPFSAIAPSVIDSPEHRRLARRAAQESLVLLENRRDLLPLRPEIRRLAVIGPGADDVGVLLGTYHGTPSRAVTIRAGIAAAAAPRGIAVAYARGDAPGGSAQESYTASARALAVAAHADAVVLTLGLSPAIEGEEGDTPGPLAGDRADIELPPAQDRLLRSVAGLGKPTVLVLTGGGALGLQWAQQHVDAILMAFYPGEEGGTAVADVLFGDVNPAGRLPVTFYRSVRALPPFTDYRMDGRTYRYLRQPPVYAFGHGLSYTTFRYANLQVTSVGDVFTVHVDVDNTGPRAGDEVVQVYASALAPPVPAPQRWLVGFTRLSLHPGERKTLNIPLPAHAFSLVDPSGRRQLFPGDYAVTVGGRQPGDAAPGLTAHLTIAAAAR